jgi:hypothetical protein
MIANRENHLHFLPEKPILKVQTNIQMSKRIFVNAPVAASIA